MAEERTLMQRLRDLYEEQHLAVLATVGEENQPYTSLMAFTIDEELQTLFFATYADTRKYRNLQHEADVALLVDNRQEQEGEFENALAVTIEGQVYAVKEAALHSVRELMTLRHPQMESFLNDSETRFFFVKIRRHIAVTGLGGVEVLEIQGDAPTEREDRRK
ncbi:MAG: pyridoxamine 5'-phosphate oxidase family protein [Anaerolineales bacterium]